MKAVYEKGHVLLSVLIVMAFGVFILISIKSAIQKYLLQERALRIVQERAEDEISQFRNMVVGQESLGSVGWSVVGVDEKCRIFGDEYEYLDFHSGLYGKRLSKDCYESGRVFYGIYNVISEGSRNRVIYSYMLRDLPAVGIDMVSSWRVQYESEQICLEVKYLGQVYRYFLFEKEDSRSVELLQSVAFNSFFLLRDEALWLLPQSSVGVPQRLGVVDSQGKNLIGDFVNDDGVYLLWAVGSKEEVGRYLSIEMDFYEWGERSILNGKRTLLSEDLFYDAYEVVSMDQSKILIKLGEDSLFAVGWGGDAVWGDKFLWEKQSGLKCPLQSEVFEPILGWELGCQRKEGVKVGFK